MISLEDAKDWLRDRASDGGARCPCCNRWTKIYPRRIGGEHCSFLFNLLRHKRDPRLDDWVHHSVANTYKNRNSRGYPTIGWFDLAETGKCEDENPDKKWSGLWRLTMKGDDFLNARIKIPKYIYTYNAGVLEVSEETVSIHDALPVDFSYTEMMAMTVPPGTQGRLF